MQNILSQNYFELFDIPVSFCVDTQKLAHQYREVQKSVHPDKFADASDAEKRLSVQIAAHINQANQVLKSPQLRARYLLELRGITFDDEKDTNLDPAFLMEQIELRERLESCADISDPQAELDKILLTLKNKQEQALLAIEKMLLSDDLNQLQAAKKEVQKLQFLDKLQQEAETVEEKLFADI